MSITGVAPFQRRENIEHVYLCLPWTHIDIREGVISASEEHRNRASSYQERLCTGIKKSQGWTTSG